MADTGNGTTLTLSSTGAVGNVRRITGNEETLGKIGVSHLGTTGHNEYIPGDLSEPGEVTFEVELDPTTAKPGLGTVETATVTFPLGSGGSTAANTAGTGFLTKVSEPTFENETLMVRELTFAFDGKTGPTHTVQS